MKLSTLFSGITAAAAVAFVVGWFMAEDPAEVCRLTMNDAEHRITNAVWQRRQETGQDIARVRREVVQYRVPAKWQTAWERAQ